MTETSNRVRWAVSRQSGATTWTRKDGDEWRTTCLNHGTETTATSRGPAWKNGSTPANFCPKCKAIAAGKAERITEGRLDLPTAKKATTTRKAAASKKAAPKPKAAPAAKATPAKKATK